MHCDLKSRAIWKPICSFAIATAVLLAGRACADESPPSDLRLTFANGASALSESGSGFRAKNSFNLDAELSGLLRWHFLAMGSLVHADIDLGGYAGLSLGAQAGLAHRSNDGSRVELLGVVGMHLLTGLGAEPGLFGGGTEGFSATLPFVGVRAGVFKEFVPEANNHFTVGLVGMFDIDVGAATGKTTSEPDGTTTNATASAERYGAMISIGWTHDFAGGR